MSGASGTARLTAFCAGPAPDDAPSEVRHAARRHLVDTMGAMIAGLSGDVVARLAPTIGTVPEGAALPGFSRPLLPEHAAYLGGVGAHGLELDDGYRLGSVHPGVAVLPALIAAASTRTVSGRAALSAFLAGYETITAVAEACHPALRQRGFHPTSAVGPFGAAMAAGRVLGLDAGAMANAFGLAASAAGGIFAFLGGGGDVKRLHAGQAARGGYLAARHAEAGLDGPPDVLEARFGFGQAFAHGEPGPLLDALPAEDGSDDAWRILDCYMKPYACCRHLQPAYEALGALMREHGLSAGEIETVAVEAYSVAVAHAGTGWNDFASAQLSFPYVMALALAGRPAGLACFGAGQRADPAIPGLAAKLSFTATPEMDALYPRHRPSRVRVVARGRTFEAEALEALGCRELPLDDAAVSAKFLDLAAPVLGRERAEAACRRLWALEEEPDVAALFAMMRPAS